MKIIDKSGRGEALAEKIVERFKSGNLPAALAQRYIAFPGRHCEGYSLLNQMIVAIFGEPDAMGFRQWNDVGRSVKKGAKALWIFAPVTVKAKDKTNDMATGDAKEKTDARRLIGFKVVPIFGYNSTDGAAYAPVAESARFVDSLPLLDVARAWGLTVGTYNGNESGALGRYRHNSGIALGVENLSTWAHELVHAADDRATGLPCVASAEEKAEAEIVAELGGATLLCALGKEKDADMGGAWDYCERWASNTGKEPFALIARVIGRVGKAVDLILEAANAGKTAPAMT